MSSDKPLEAAIVGVVENPGTTNQQSRGGGRTLLEQLRELQDAKNQGLLSEEEHATAKAKALAVHSNGSQPASSQPAAGPSRYTAPVQQQAPMAWPLNGHYFSFRTGGDPVRVVDRFEARQQGPNHVTYYRSSGRVGSTDRVDSSRAKPMESYTIRGNQLSGPVSATIEPNGDIKYSHGYTSRKESGTGGGTVVTAQPAWEPSSSSAPTSGGSCPSSVHPKAHLVDGGMILVQRGSPMACVFTEAHQLRSGATVQLTLASHPGKSIGKKYLTERQFGEWRYIESDVNQSPVRVYYEGENFLKLADSELVLDVAFWKFQANTAVNFVGGHNADRTRLGGGGRDWAINDDGTIGLKHHPHLVLGTHPPPGEWSAPFPRISTKDIQGKWCCVCIPGGFACFDKVANGEDRLIHRGCLCLFFGLPLPFEEHRRRHPNTNGFYKEGEEGEREEGDIDTYCNSSCVCNGLAISAKI